MYDRYWAKVVVGMDCFGWSGHSDEKGYGRIRVDRGHTDRAHRVSWFLENGPIPDGMQVLHRCDNPPCTRPNHLFLGTNADNHNDKVRKGRQWRPAGELHHGAKLNEQDVRRIRSMLADGCVPAVICAEYGIKKSCVSGIHTGKSWASLK